MQEPLVRGGRRGVLDKCCAKCVWRHHFVGGASAPSSPRLHVPRCICVVACHHHVTQCRRWRGRPPRALSGTLVETCSHRSCQLLPMSGMRPHFGSVAPPHGVTMESDTGSRPAPSLVPSFPGGRRWVGRQIAARRTFAFGLSRLERNRAVGQQLGAASAPPGSVM